MTTATASSTPPAGKPKSGLKIFLIVLLAVFIAVIAGGWIVKRYFFPEQLQPVELSQQEQQRLDQKLRQLGIQPDSSSGSSGSSANSSGELVPEPYSEAGASREVSFTEKELNGLIARNPEMAKVLAIDLADNLASAKLVMKLEPDFPVLGGQTIRLNAGIEAAFANDRPRIVLRGVSLWGVPLPNAWLGNLKNVDLVGQFGGDEGFWKSFADGIESLEVREGTLHVRLKE